MPEKPSRLKEVDRRTIIKATGASAVAVTGLSGVSSAHHVQDLKMEPAEVTAEIGESVTFEVHWQSGHAAEACFVFAIEDGDGGWIKLAEHSETATEVGEHKHFDQAVTIPELSPDTYTLRVSASEAYHRCPNPGEKTYPILGADVTVEAVCVGNSNGAENADPPGHDKDEGDPGGSAHDSDEDGDKPGERKGHCKFD